MTDDDFDEIEILPDDTDDGYRRVRFEDLKAMRAAARKRGAAERELADYKRQAAVRTAGIEGLSERQIAVIAREADGDQSPENLRNIAEDLGFVQRAASPTEEEQQIDAEIDQQTAAVAAGNGATPTPAQNTVTDADVASWGVDKRMRLLNQHPDLHERLLRGEPVALPQGFN